MIYCLNTLVSLGSFAEVINMPHRKAAPKHSEAAALRQSKTLIRRGEALLKRIRSSGLTRPYRNYIFSQLRQMMRELE